MAQEKKELRVAAAKGDINQVKILLKNISTNGINIDEKSTNGKTALHWACEKVATVVGPIEENNHVKIIFELIKANANENLRDQQGKLAYEYLSQNLSDKTNRQNFIFIAQNLIHIKTSKLNLSLIPDVERKKQIIAFNNIISKRFIEILISVFSNNGIFSKLSKEPSSIKIIDLACGQPPVIGIDLFFRVFYGSIPRYYGVDINASQIEHNKKLYDKYENFTFIEASAIDLDQLRYILVHNLFDIGLFDIGILRNGNFTDKEHVKLFNQMLTISLPTLLKPQGSIIATSYSPQEIEVIKTLLKVDSLPSDSENEAYYSSGKFNNPSQIEVLDAKSNQTVPTDPDQFFLRVTSNPPQNVNVVKMGNLK